jgi:hypothetical protein
MSAFSAVIIAISALIVVPYLVVPDKPAAAPTKVSTTVTWTVLQPALIVITIFCGLYVYYRSRLEWNALNGLRVDVEEFTDARKDGAQPSTKDVTARFKRKLNTSRIYSPTALPGTAGSYDFIQIVENAGEAAPAGWWKAVARLLRLLRPPAAYRVSGTIVDSGASDVHKLVVELVRLPRVAATPLIIEGEHWDRLLEQAANSVAALIFPRSKMCKRRPQWAEWWGYAFPTELFDAYQRAHEFQSRREYDRALAEFYRALRFDPTNVYIRLEIGQLQERLDLHLDALVTYDDVITICSRDDRGLAAWWNGAGFAPERSGSRHRRIALLVARYRHALMLGHGDRIANQWWLREDVCGHEAHWNERQRQRDYMRDALQRRFTRYRRTRLGIEGEDRVDEILSIEHATPLLPKDTRDECAQALRGYLCALAQYEFERLRADHPRYQLTLRFARRTRDLVDLVTARGVRLCLVWAVLRRAMAQSEAHAPVARPEAVWAETAPVPVAPSLFPRQSWPPNPYSLRSVITIALGNVNRTIWHEHYNAACVCSVALLRGTLKPAEATELRKLAISHLHRAAAASHSGYLAQRRTWLLREDPDLASLRGTPEFRNFELVTFSRGQPVPLRPQALHVWELVTYQTQLTRCLAEIMARRWRKRLLEEGASEVPGEWGSVEVDAWRHVAQLAVSHRDWKTRHDCVTTLLRWIKEDGGPRVDLGLPEYSQQALYLRYANAVGHQEPLDGQAGGSISAINWIAQGYIDRCNERMRTLADGIYQLGAPSGAAAGCPNARSGIGGLSMTRSPLITRLDVPKGSRDELQAVRPNRAKLWNALAVWFDDELEGPSYADRQEKFAESLRQL